MAPPKVKCLIVFASKHQCRWRHLPLTAPADFIDEHGWAPLAGSKMWFGDLILYLRYDLLNFEDPLNIEAAMYKKNKVDFQAKVQEYISGAKGEMKHALVTPMTRLFSLQNPHQQ
ncbi:hypothetical protein MSG28_010616 [Choristoneura fumiferana]|uniref:Uncharacterized protein n=1 Tax=Choristoneura fumiferana TaxID=7141 RepID=A0ACC0KMZ9_CHOFU|nr:hypothetical protein MSG28_010616 [Choristoneura fumiferana]